ncbi:MAG: hypothetical protein KDA21_12655, partial [Phycisphaerales bacterium]|nr:hypothetical protein [Phycisphaerales bacterium]
RAYIINEGRVLRDGTPRDLINDEMVKRSYLGSMFRGDEFDEHHATRQTTPAGTSEEVTS